MIVFKSEQLQNTAPLSHETSGDRASLRTFFAGLAECIQSFPAAIIINNSQQQRYEFWPLTGSAVGSIAELAAAIPVEMLPKTPIGAVVLIRQVESKWRPNRELLQQRFDLTAAEVRVVLLLFDGHSRKDIAALLKVSMNTLKSQLKSIFSKTGVSRQSELIRLLFINKWTLDHPLLPIR